MEQVESSAALHSTSDTAASAAASASDAPALAPVAADSAPAAPLSPKELSLGALEEEPQPFPVHNFVHVHPLPSGDEDGFPAFAASKKSGKSKTRSLGRFELLPPDEDPARARPLLIKAAAPALVRARRKSAGERFVLFSLLSDATLSSLPLALCFVAGLLLLRMEHWMAQQMRARSSTGRLGTLLATLWRVWCFRTPIDPLDVRLP